jgi:hypothetical protein
MKLMWIPNETESGSLVATATLHVPKYKHSTCIQIFVHVAHLTKKLISPPPPKKKKKKKNPSP